MTGRGLTVLLVQQCISQEAKLLSTGHWEDSLTLIHSRLCGDHTALQLHIATNTLPRPESANTRMQRSTKPKLPETLKPPCMNQDTGIDDSTDFTKPTRTQEVLSTEPGVFCDCYQSD